MKIDLGCDDFERAACNREMVAKKANIMGYLQVEAVLRGWSLKKPLPDWIPQGQLRVVGKGEARRYGINKLGGFDDKDD